MAAVDLFLHFMLRLKLILAIRPEWISDTVIHFFFDIVKLIILMVERMKIIFFYYFLIITLSGPKENIEFFGLKIAETVGNFFNLIEKIIKCLQIYWKIWKKYWLGLSRLILQKYGNLKRIAIKIGLYGLGWVIYYLGSVK